MALIFEKHKRLIYMISRAFATLWLAYPLVFIMMVYINQLLMKLHARVLVRKKRLLRVNTYCRLENYIGESKAESSTRQVVERPWVVCILLFWKTFESSHTQTVSGWQVVSLCARRGEQIRRGGRVLQAGISSQVSFSYKLHILYYIMICRS